MAFDINNINYRGFECSWSAVIKMSNLTFMYGRLQMESRLNEFVKEHFENLEQELHCFGTVQKNWLTQKLLTARNFGWEGEQVDAISQLVYEGPKAQANKNLNFEAVFRSLTQTFVQDEQALTLLYQQRMQAMQNAYSAVTV